MDINDNNFKIIMDYLQSTLSPDPNIRRPGNKEMKKS